jgi:hypothetical protein
MAQHDDRAVVPLGNLAQLVEHAADFLVLAGIGTGEERGQRLDDDQLGPVLLDDAFDEVEVGGDLRRAFLVRLSRPNAGSSARKTTTLVAAIP